MGKFLLGVLTGFALVFLAVVLVLVAAVRMRNKPPGIADNSVLVLRLEGEVPEKPGVELPILDNGRGAVTVTGLWVALRQAAADRRIKALVLQPEGLQAGWGKIEEIRTDAADVETIYYIYVIAKDETLVGEISLRNLLLALPVDKLSSFMRTDVITVQLTDDQRDVAKKIAKYNLLALPVVDEEKKLKGIVTVDDAIDVVLPTAWKKRVPKAFG